MLVWEIDAKMVSQPQAARVRVVSSVAVGVASVRAPVFADLGVNSESAQWRVGRAA